MLGYFGDESTRIRRSEAIFLSCRDQANKPEFFKKGKVRLERGCAVDSSIHICSLQDKIL